MQQQHFPTFSRDKPFYRSDAVIKGLFKDPKFPLNTFVGNQDAVERLKIALFPAFKDIYRVCPANFALLGPASAGKTMLVKLFAKSLKTPCAEIHPRSVPTLKHLAGKMAEALDNYDLDERSCELVPYAPGKFKVPAMTVFIDEVHDLKDSVVQGLLKATERSDGILCTEDGWELDCSNVTWIIATTERGQLFDPFDTRFTKIILELYSKPEMAEIIKRAVPDWIKHPGCNKIYEAIANFGGRIPRECIEFAKEFRNAIAGMPGETLEHVFNQLRIWRKIDEFGMSEQHISILTALGTRGAISKKNLGIVIEVRCDELERFQMPGLLMSTIDTPALVEITNKGYMITQAGLNELDKRGIENLGKAALKPQTGLN